VSWSGGEPPRQMPDPHWLAPNDGAGGSGRPAADPQDRDLPLDSHLHTIRSPDANAMLEAYCVLAAQRGIAELAITDHVDFDPTMPAYAFASFHLAGLAFDAVRVSALIASLVLLGCLAVLLRFSALGRVIRATAQQTLAARLCGVNVRHVYALTFAVSAAFAGAAGIVIGIILPFSPADEALWTLNAFVVVVLGGVGSPAGALLGGLLLAVPRRNVPLMPLVMTLAATGGVSLALGAWSRLAQRRRGHDRAGVRGGASQTA